MRDPHVISILAPGSSNRVLQHCVNAFWRAALRLQV
jgi:hypothetical protein